MNASILSPLEPLDQILSDVERAIGGKAYYLAIMMTLALPDICACLESPTGETRRRAAKSYRAWCDANLRLPHLTSDDLYRLRCGVVHQGHFGHPDSQFDSVIFIAPNPSHGAFSITTVMPDVKFGGKTVQELGVAGRLLQVSMDIFCGMVLEAVRAWAVSKARDPYVSANLPKLIRFRPSGLPPFLVNIPIVA